MGTQPTIQQQREVILEWVHRFYAESVKCLNNFCAGKQQCLRDRMAKVRLLEIQKDISDYVTYVFVNLEATSQRDLYIMCTKFPNWESKPLSKNDVGYLKYKENLAGVSM